MRIVFRAAMPEAVGAMLGLQKVVDESVLDPKLLELIKVRASQINGCAYCLDIHTKDAIAIGENDRVTRAGELLVEVRHFDVGERNKLEVLFLAGQEVLTRNHYRIRTRVGIQAVFVQTAPPGTLPGLDGVFRRPQVPQWSAAFCLERAKWA